MLTDSTFVVNVSYTANIGIGMQGLTVLSKVKDLVTRALADFSEVFSALKPNLQKELMRVVLNKVILAPDSLKIGLYGRPPEVKTVQGGDARSQTFDWLPGQDSNLQPSG